LKVVDEIKKITAFDHIVMIFAYFFPSFLHQICTLSRSKQLIFATLVRWWLQK